MCSPQLLCLGAAFAGLGLSEELSCDVGRGLIDEQDEPCPTPCLLGVVGCWMVGCCRVLDGGVVVWWCVVGLGCVVVLLWCCSVVVLWCCGVVVLWVLWCCVLWCC